MESGKHWVAWCVRVHLYYVFYSIYSSTLCPFFPLLLSLSLRYLLLLDDERGLANTLAAMVWTISPHRLALMFRARTRLGLAGRVGRSYSLLLSAMEGLRQFLLLRVSSVFAQ